MPAPYQPVVPTGGIVESFDLAPIVRDLMDDEAFKKSGRVARTLARCDQMTTVLTVMRKDSELHEHVAPGPATVTVISGTVQFAFEKPQRDVTLARGSIVVFANDASHRVSALEDSAILIVIGGKAG